MSKTAAVKVVLGLAALMFAFSAPVNADVAVPELGGYASLTLPKGKPRGSIILMPGSSGNLGITGDGQITRMQRNLVVRTRASYAAAGYATLTLDASGDAAAAVRHMQAIARPVVVFATSRGATRIHSALGGQPDGIIIASGMLDVFQYNVGAAEYLPRTLILHHRHDTCRVTMPGLVDPFIAWSAGRARVVWLDGGTDEGDSCEANGHHGLAGLDGQVISRVTGFAASLRGR